MIFNRFGRDSFLVKFFRAELNLARKKFQSGFGLGPFGRYSSEQIFFLSDSVRIGMGQFFSVEIGSCFDFLVGVWAKKNYLRVSG